MGEACSICERGELKVALKGGLTLQCTKACSINERAAEPLLTLKKGKFQGPKVRAPHHQEQERRKERGQWMLSALFLNVLSQCSQWPVCMFFNPRLRYGGSVHAPWMRGGLVQGRVVSLKQGKTRTV
eukprot:1157994-Pelagomonas_calceolata.AAC.3